MNKKIRCAIYTRKSTEEGLEQDFNSLDAQREACEAYIKSQQHEGWVLIKKQYNDGGFSGGTLERPAVKELFKDIEAGEVDIVVVYKVDRLTRSLMDFSKIVEIFDKNSASFVSITQHFNTTTSMGRLTLNMLLSFAQFEREVTGERIRDKVAASKKKGMWMGGKPPIGYKLENKKLIVDKAQSPKVQMIFERYLEFKSVPKLVVYLKENNIKTRSEVHFKKGALYHLLKNKTYAGLIVHKENVYNGEHQGIIAAEVFENAQKLLIQNRVSEKNSINAKFSSLLSGKLFDDNGNHMSPSHSNTRGKRYRYYVSQAIMQYRKNEAGTISKIPAGEIEKVVTEEIKNFLFNIKNIQEYISHYDVQKQKELLEKIKSLKKERNINNIFIRAILSKVTLYKDKIEIILCKKQLLNTLDSITYGTQLTEDVQKETLDPILITKEIQISKVSPSGSILIISNSENSEPIINSQLVKAVVKSFYWNDLLLSGQVKSSTDIQKMENLKDNTYVKDILRLRFFAPDIIEKILNGAQPLSWSTNKLLGITTLDWNEQRKLLNI